MLLLGPKPIQRIDDGHSCIEICRLVNDHRLLPAHGDANPMVCFSFCNILQTQTHSRILSRLQIYLHKRPITCSTQEGNRPRQVKKRHLPFTTSSSAHLSKHPRCVCSISTLNWNSSLPWHLLLSHTNIQVHAWLFLSLKCVKLVNWTIHIQRGCVNIEKHPLQ